MPMNLIDLDDFSKREQNVFWFIINQKIIEEYSTHLYLPQFVNFSKNFVDPKAGANTQKGERLWKELWRKKRDCKEFQENMSIFTYLSFVG